MSKRTRDAGLDAARGLAMGLMILVNNAGDWSHVYAPLRHAEWHGFTLADLVFPLFLWVSGAAAAWSLARLRDEVAVGKVTHSAGSKALRRGLTLFGLGLLLNAIPTWDWSTLRVYGVLQRIALVALFLWFWARTMPRQRDLAGALVLLVVWMLLLIVPEQGLDKALNLGAQVDRWSVGQAHLYLQGVYDPEGLLSTLGACATGLLGLHAGERIRAAATQSPLHTGTRAVLRFGAACLLSGLALSLLVPINKPLWTSSFVLWTAGLCSAVWWLLSRASSHTWWRYPHELLVAMGHNALLLYVGAGFLARALLWWKLPWQGGESSARNVLYQTYYAPLTEPHLASLLFAASNLLIWCPLLMWLHRKGWRWSA